MAKKRVTKATKNRLRVLTPVLLFVILFCIGSFFSGLYKYNSLLREEASLNKELKSLKRDEKELTSEINKLKDSEYIAKYARENYYYTKNGEYVIKIQDDSNDNEDLLNEDPKIYIVLGGSIAVLVILIFVIAKVIGKNNEKKKK